MLVLATQAEYEKILHNPAISLVEKKVWRKGNFRSSIVCEGVVIAMRMTGKVDNYFKVDRTYLDIK